ncbi:GNAT family N-acetyltransferase [Thalassospira indica]|uniref:N-acetyltransferase n=1 Tax=Thalassospira indica TaxID=1891279 RepID=A0ABM6XWU1_9PROT|nr:GNAT family protein [Thalassospira indica]AXO14165.1 N-acetyltransferase [Thalassospira indica]OAZ12364.1 GCN5 family acetyltransferase [Thalassospira profundimaris]
MRDIVTDRLIIRRFSEADAAELFEYISNPRANCFMADKVSTLEQAKVMAQKRANDASCVAVCLKETGALIGELMLHQDDEHQADTYSVGWNFNGKFEGKGYASESARALFEHLFTQRDARRLYAYVEDDNFKSQKLCEKLGMRKEACFMEFISFVNNPDGTPKYENTFQYAILKKEWLRRHT